MGQPLPVDGPCANWDPVWCCDLTGLEAVTGNALTAASEILYALSARRYGLCTVTYRPCRRECYQDAWPYGVVPLSGMWPRPAWIDGQWFNLTCGGCPGTCTCATISEFILPGPVASITEIKIDGVALDAGEYRVDDYRKVIRLGALWPLCNDVNLADTEVGTWSVTAVLGEPVPVIGRLAVGELACEIARFCTGQDCAIPKRTTSITRQGINMNLADAEGELAFVSNLYFANLFLQFANPEGLPAPSQVYDVDGPGYRIAGIL